MSKAQLVREDLGGSERSRDSGGFGSSGVLGSAIFTMSNSKRHQTIVLNSKAPLTLQGRWQRVKNQNSDW